MERINRKIIIIKWLERGSVLFFILVTAGCALLIFINLAYQSKTYPGIKVAGINIGGTNLDEANIILQQRVNKFKKSPLVFKFPPSQIHILQNQNINQKIISWEISSQDLGIDFQVKKTVGQAHAIGRNESLFKNIIGQIKALLGNYHIDMAFTIDEEEHKKNLLEILSQIETPATNATLNLQKDNLEPVFSRTGWIIDKDILKAMLNSRVSTLKSQTITFFLKKDYPEIEDNEVDQAKKEAELIAKRPLKLTYENKTWAIDQVTLKKWMIFNNQQSTINNQKELIYTFSKNLDDYTFQALDITPPSLNKPNLILSAQLDQNKIGEYLISNIAYKINREPQNARFQIENGIVTLFAKSSEGENLNIKKSAKLIALKIKENSKILGVSTSIPHSSSISPQPFIFSSLIVEKTPPEIRSTSEAEMLGIKTLIGEGVSNFAYSPRNRIHNIHLGAAKFNGVLIKPGEVFSFLKTLGSTGPSGGYLPELVIRENRTIPEYGGGICQVSTTCFRVAAQAGLPIIERQPHAYPVRYYNPQGTDATIYIPSPDLKFKNDYPSYILIQTKVQGNTLIFEFWGTPDGREISFKGPYQYNKKPDGSMNTVWYRTITWPSGKIKKDTFTSHYDSPLKYPH